MSNNKLEINDLGPEAKEQNHIVITLDDLETLPPEPSTRQYPGMPSGMSYPGMQSEKATGLKNLGASQLKQNLVAGLVGGVIAWGITELIFGFDERHRFGLPMLLEVSLWAGTLSAAIGGILGAADGITSGVKEKAIKGGIIGAVVGFIGGSIGGVLAQLLYSYMGGGRAAGTKQVFARTFAWALGGFFVGLAQGLPGGKAKKIVNGLVGGLIGGGIGGLGFDFIGTAIGGGSVSRLFGLVAMGGATGAAIGMIDEARKEAWLRVVNGPQTGKQFIIYGEVTRIGSDPKNEIVLVKDPAIAPEHCRIIAAPGRFTFQAAVGAAVGINGQQATNILLKRGDSITLGQTTMIFEERTVSATPGQGVAAR